jgi:1-acylglycerol-3-phosphate O-acyltransferase
LTVLKAIAVLIRIPVSLIKLLLIVVLIGLYSIFDVLLGILVFNPVVYWFKFLFLGLITRTALFLAGFYYIESEQVARKRGETKKLKTSVHLIICNHSSYVDYLYLQSRYNPVFLNVALDGTVYQTGVIGGIWNCSVDAPESGSSSLQSFLDSYQSTNPIVLFPEGSTTNGRGLLEFGIDLSKIEISKVRIDIIGLKYVWANYCPCFTTGSIFGHFWNVLNQVSALLLRNSFSIPFKLNNTSISMERLTKSHQSWLKAFGLERCQRQQRTRLNS